MSRVFVLTHNLIVTGLLLGVLSYAFSLAAPELWFGLKTSQLLRVTADSGERLFVSILAFSIYSAAYLATAAIFLSWIFFLFRNYAAALGSIYLPALSAALLVVLFGLPIV